MFRKTFLFLTTVLTATSAFTGYGATDFLQGNVNAVTFLDWFNNTEKHAHAKGLIVLDLIPLLFLTVQIIFFFKDSKRIKGLFAVLALLANLVGVFILTQQAYPIASQIASWTPENLPSDWVVQKDNWLKHIGLYGLMGIVGWLCFVITYFVSERKNKTTVGLSRFPNFIKNALAFFLTFITGLSVARLYDFCLFPAQYGFSGATFIELHRPLDLAIRAVGPVLFTVIGSIYAILIILLFIEKSTTKAWLFVAALITLLLDTFIALQCNGPINDLFLTWTPTTVPGNWATVRDEWLSYHVYRNILMLLGFVCVLLTYFVAKKKAPAKPS